MKKIIDPFTDFLPKLDLHGMDRVLAKIKVEEFINDNIKLSIFQLVKRNIYQTLVFNKKI